jgi:hypothetical protein
MDALQVRARIDALLDLERHGDHRIVPLWLDVLANRGEPEAVRVHVLKRLQNKQRISGCRPAVAEAIMRALSEPSGSRVCVQAALALAAFTDVDGVLTALGSRALNAREPIDLRYSVFTSLQCAGPCTVSVAVLRQMATDEAFGPCARSVLLMWQLG